MGKENLTVTNKLIIREPGLMGDKEGYARVLFRENGPTRELIKSLGAGERFRPGLFRDTSAFVTYYVDLHDDLQSPFSGQWEHKSSVSGRTFYLDFVLRYKIADPELLVKHVDRDPLSLIRSQIKDKLSSTIAALPWETILDENTDFVRQAVSKETRSPTNEILANDKYLKRYALDHYGIEIIAIEVQRRLNADVLKIITERGRRPEIIDLEKERGEHALEIKELQEKTALEKRKLELDREAFEREQELIAAGHQKDLEEQAAWRDDKLRFQRTAVQVTEDFVVRCGEQFRSVPEIARLLADLRGLAESVRLVPDRAALDALPSVSISSLTHVAQTNDPMALLTSGGITELVRRVEQASQRLDEAEARKDLLATALHVIAEGQLDLRKRKGMTDLVERLSAALREFAQDLDAGDVELIKRLVDAYRQDP